MSRQPFRAVFDQLRDLRSALKAAGGEVNLVKRTNVVISTNSGQEGSDILPRRWEWPPSGRKGGSDREIAYGTASRQES